MLSIGHSNRVPPTCTAAGNELSLSYMHRRVIQQVARRQSSLLAIKFLTLDLRISGTHDDDDDDDVVDDYYYV